MKIKMLVENTTISKEYKCKHGLSIFIETQEQKIIFDLGSNDLFKKNAFKLGVNISDIDVVVISHGHLDHGGGLKTFLESNNKAKIFMHKLAFEQHYANILGFKFKVGLDNNLKECDRIFYTEESMAVYSNIQLFSNITEKIFCPKSNNNLYAKIDGEYKTDLFEHEQNLIIKENGKYILFCGCAHKGIINILEKAELLCGQELDYVIGGFHLFNPLSRKIEDVNLIESIANKLKKRKTRYFTCHCTGEKPFSILHSYMGDQVQYLSTGSSIVI